MRLSSATLSPRMRVIHWKNTQQNRIPANTDDIRIANTELPKLRQKYKTKISSGGCAKARLDLYARAKDVRLATRKCCASSGLRNVPEAAQTRTRKPKARMMPAISGMWVSGQASTRG